ncbi:symmetrical bis(5'-nucleosyl)-tetraphosphatase [Dokdonella sp.]|uniref:symmetrical bis(5'-nucleosyl)-tetraphosphatase n=1 Tax=Dokdonella sp. TaxID=2291710 RepID=UPI0031C924FF|nr:symmetrical bis(5'-nucleosyl)-tetraphosphatase [Dokdonella sp.]
MATWAIGDVQGCDDELAGLIDAIQFNPARDTLWFCGDLVNRGGQSLAVLRRVKAFGERAIVVLGNHDLSLLAVAERRREEQERVNLELRQILFAPDRDELLDWLRSRELVHVDRQLGFLLVHAGLFPRWSTTDAERIAHEVEDKLRSTSHHRLLRQLFGNKPDLWTPKLRGIERWRAAINVFTRMRYCDVRGRIGFADKGPPGTQRPGLYPWFSVPGRVERDLRVVCGHWSALDRFIGLGIHAIDTGCVWGGVLTAMRLDGEERQFVTVKSSHPPAHPKHRD